MSNPKSIVISRYLSMQLLAAAIEYPNQAVCGLVQHETLDSGSARAISFSVADVEIKAMATDRDDWLFWQEPGHAPELTSQDIELLPSAALYLLISLNIKGVLEMKAWALDNSGKNGQPIEIPIEVTG